MKLIIGLGNPGKRYEKTRHNLGFMVVEALAREFSIFNFQSPNNKNLKAEILQEEYKGEKIILSKPQTFMNNSGLSVFLISKYLNIPISDIWIVHDDVDLPLGSIRIKFGGGSAGHNGVESIIESLGTDEFWRFRIGIGKQDQRSKIKDQKQVSVEDYVLEEFGKEELEEVEKMVKKGSEAIKMALEEGMDKAMNKYNS